MIHMNSGACKKLSETQFLVVLTVTGECTWKSGKVSHHFFWKVLEAHSHYHKKLSTRNRTSRNRNSNRKHFSHHPMIVMNQSWLALSTGRILRKNSCLSRRPEGNYFFPLWNRGNVACHLSQLTVFQYEKTFAQAANWNLNRDSLGANCQSKYQHCMTILHSGLQTNNWFHCNSGFLRRSTIPMQDRKNRFAPTLPRWRP